MSATGRGTIREKDDFYRTPGWAVQALLPHLPRFTSVLDPCCGDGAILEQFNSRRTIDLTVSAIECHGIELDPKRASIASTWIEGGAQIECRNALGPEPWPKVDLIITNPPYKLAMDFVKRALAERREATEPGGATTVAMLLRVGWACSLRRAAFHRRNPSEINFLPKRPPFAASIACRKTKKKRGCKWKVLQDLRDPRPKVVPRVRQPRHHHHDRFVGVRVVRMVADARRTVARARSAALSSRHRRGPNNGGRMTPVGPVMVFGIEGKLSPTRTPALRGPVLVDSRGFRVLDEPDGFEVVGDAPLVFPADRATPLCPPIEAVRGYTCLVLGARDCDVLRQSARSPIDVDAYPCRNLSFADCTQVGGGQSTQVVWHCSMDDAYVAMDVLRDAALRSLAGALRRGDLAGAHADAWWLQRTSRDPMGWYIAAEGLHLAGHAMEGLKLLQSARALFGWSAEVQIREACATLEGLIHVRIYMTNPIGDAHV